MAAAVAAFLVVGALAVGAVSGWLADFFVEAVAVAEPEEPLRPVASGTESSGYTPPTVRATEPTTTTTLAPEDDEPEVLPEVVEQPETTAATTPSPGPRRPTSNSTAPNPAPTTTDPRPTTTDPGPTATTTPADITNPTVTLSTPSNRAVYNQGSLVNASYSCADSGSGITSCVGTVPNGRPITTSILGQRTFSVTATDAAGNTTTVTHTYTVVDITNPTVTLTRPADGATFTQGAVVNASYSCADSGSGIESCVGHVPSGSPINTSALGERTFTVTATDRAGNTTTVSHVYTVVDTTSPTVSLVTPADGATYQQNSTVNAQYSCSDLGSGIASCSGSVPNGSPINTSILGSRTFTVTAQDNAGNTATVTHTYTVVENADLMVTIFTPANGAQYLQGSVIIAEYTCSAPGGIAECQGTVASGDAIDTAQPGERTFTVTATDHAGNTAVVTHIYRVAPNRPN